MTQRVLTGITTTGTLHLGNYVGAIRPAIAASRESGVESFYFMADYHALIKCDEPARVARSRLEITATWIAAGLDPERTFLYRQSDIPEIPELTWLLTCVTAKGQMNRAHAYKGAVDANIAAGEDADAGISMGLFSYPILMAADILMFNAHRVPVGKDQAQHIEMARDVAQRFNHLFSPPDAPLFVLPEAEIEAEMELLPGLDGRKMSKSYDNVIEMREPPTQVEAKIRTMPTDPQRVRRTDAGDPARCPVWQFHKVYSDDATRQWASTGCTTAGIGCLDCKQPVIDAILREQQPWRDRAEQYLANPKQVHWIVEMGTERARTVARQTMKDVRDVMGLAY